MLCSQMISGPGPPYLGLLGERGKRGRGGKGRGEREEEGGREGEPYLLQSLLFRFSLAHK